MPSNKRPTRPKKSSGPDGVGEKCFVIMPFRGWFDKYFDAIFKPAIEAAGLAPLRSDDLYRPSAIIHDIWSMTKDAKVILADLTGRNPNVFYELGLAHAIAKPAVLVTESIDDVPFDLQSLRVIPYDKNEPDWGNLLESKLTRALKETLQSPTKSVLPTFLQTIEEASKPSLSRNERELLELRLEVAGLRRQVLRQSDLERAPDIGPQEAERQIRDMVQRGYPPALIVGRLRDRGVPRTFTQDVIDRYIPRSQPEPKPDSKEPPAGDSKA